MLLNRLEFVVLYFQEKYGPKGQGKAPNVTNVKTNNDAKQKPDVDVNVGLSEHPSMVFLCNTIATSKQTLLLHAEGKKHRAKARAFHAANKQPERAESTPNAKAPPQSNQKDELTRNSLSSKTQKLEASKNGTKDMAGGDMPGELGNGEMIQSKEQRKRKPSAKLRKQSSVTEEDANKKIKWKKLIKSVLKSHDPRESGFREDKSELTDMLAQKINSSSRFTVDGKHVRLVAKS
ncbi:hypothetical protein Acr_12g0010230 [Actinidia rufa]|uniref:Cell growth-regulating nucleolar protein-like winged helix domain-containing protein n=1 Tax=Actinidia rufa TaxID=165716 RepID=A0A7J0FIH0_9ERIC|nr:hypothetical protein Acr_12g0010230 [Actinidia rufa]